MSARKDRMRVVVDTNVFVRNFKARSKSSPNCRLIRLWLVEKNLQLIVSDEVIAEYLEIFDVILEMEPSLVEEWRTRFIEDPRVTVVNLARRDDASRDPDDNVFLSTSRVGRAKFLITNDKDLLEIPETAKKSLPFSIITPRDFLQMFEKGSTP